MTETDWFACTEPAPMLEFLRGKVSERKLRLFAVTCCRRIWHLLERPDQSALTVAERYADGVASPEEVTETRQSLLPMPPRVGRYLRRRAIWDAVWGTLTEQVDALHVARAAAWALHGDGELGNLAVWLRHIVGNPFHPVKSDPSWLTWNGGTVPKLARGIYEGRRFRDMPVLADALEEAGCSDRDMLLHCRRKVDHVRGCWLVDLLLGKQ
jgi:hypothetical protein